MGKTAKICWIWAAIAGFSALFTFFYGRHGYSGADEGLTMAWAWRVVNGQLPHRDFNHVLPPLSVWLHSLSQLWLPLGWQVLFERFLFFFVIGSYSWLSVNVMVDAFQPKTRTRWKALLALTAWAFSVQNFPPMPWHSLDGILLCTLAVVAWTRLRPGWAEVVAGICLVAAALTKPSFYFMIPFSALYILVIGGLRRVGYLFVAGVGATLLFGLTFAWLEILPHYLEQVTVQTRWDSLLGSGLKAYARFYAPAVIPPVLLCVILEVVARRRSQSGLRRLYPFLIWGGAFAIDSGYFIQRQQFQTPVFNVPGFLWLGAVALVFFQPWLSRRWATVLLLLGLSWCAGLSWGYQTPTFFMAPILFAWVTVSIQALRVRAWALVPFLLAVALINQAIGYQFPFGESPRSTLTERFDTVFEGLGGIHTSETNLRRYAELSALYDDYGDPYIALPSMPLTHYLTRSVPVMRVDWAIDRRSDFDLESQIEALEKIRPAVFMERQSSFRCERGPHCSGLVRYINENWIIAETREFFEVRVPRDDVLDGLAID